MFDPFEDSIPFQSHRYSSRLPARYRYTRAHFWLFEAEPGLWRVGLTDFAARTLGEIVEFAFDASPGARIAPGDLIGWIEGFKAVSDIAAAGAGEFAGGNAEAIAEPALIADDPFGRGWLCAFRGAPDPDAIDAAAYADLLGAAIDGLRDKGLPSGLGPNDDCG